jgi:uncharacterized protein (DUF2062 family)
MFKKVKKILFNLVLAEKSVTKLTLSFCLGNFIAWSATIPLQTPLIFLLSWLFRLNTTVTFTTVYLINNPFTMIPIYVADYIFGNWLLNSFLGLSMQDYNPSWANNFSIWLSKYIDLTPYVGKVGFCFWCLIIGGLILPLILSIIFYPIMRPIFSFLVNKIHKYQIEQI